MVKKGLTPRGVHLAVSVRRGGSCRAWAVFLPACDERLTRAIDTNRPYRSWATASSGIDPTCSSVLWSCSRRERQRLPPARPEPQPPAHIPDRRHALGSASSRPRDEGRTVPTAGAPD